MQNSGTGTVNYILDKLGRHLRTLESTHADADDMVVGVDGQWHVTQEDGSGLWFDILFKPACDIVV
jgi:hypothetical protein